MFDYSVFARNKLALEDVRNRSFDIFLSAYNESDRVTTVFDAVSATEKHWILHQEYDFEETEFPQGSCWRVAPSEGVIDMWERCFEELGVSPEARLAIDITGMMRPHLLLLPLMLERAGFSGVTVFYSDPVSYVSGQSTTFTKSPVEEVRVVPGYAGIHHTGIESRDCLIIGAGYDHELVKASAEAKRNADHYLLVGMPGLQPHMYQESVYRIAQAKESINDFRARTLLYAPANNPFMTAQVLSDHVGRLRSNGSVDNVYLAPVGPKSQVLGFAWYYLCEARGAATSLIFPFAHEYSRETSVGLGAIHEYVLELDSLGQQGA